MIIKSMSRSTMSFAQLYDYLTRDSEAILNAHNLYSSPYHKEALVKEFVENALHLKRSRGKNYMYHEIISLQHSQLSLKVQEKILADLTHYYLSKRAFNHLSFTALHKDKEYTHVHLMISANEVMGQKRIRLSKKEFATIQKNAELYLSQKHPELEATNHYQSKTSREKKSSKEQEPKSRTKKTNREALFKNLKDIFEKATSQNYFSDALKKSGITFYTRGKTKGVIYEGKKYRLKTLGLELSYNQLIQKIEIAKQREQQQKNRESQDFEQGAR